MAFGVLSSVASAGPVYTDGSNPTVLLDQQTLTFPGGMVQFLGSAKGAYSDSRTLLRVYVDGSLVVSENAFGALVAAVDVEAGDHTVDFEVVSLNFDVNLSQISLTVLSLA